jgi:hypothetical protein
VVRPLASQPRAQHWTRPRPIRSSWSRSQPSCAASTSTSACVARIAARVSSLPQHQSHLCRCPCCICGGRRERPDAFPIPASCSWRWPTPGVRSAVWHSSRDTDVRSHSFLDIATALVRRNYLPSPHRTPASSCQTIDSRSRRLTIPIITAHSAVQSNEVYLTPRSTVSPLQFRLGVR